MSLRRPDTARRRARLRIASAQYPVLMVVAFVSSVFPADRAAPEVTTLDKPFNVPTWAEYAASFPACGPLPRRPGPADFLAVVDVHGQPEVMPLAEAWRRTESTTRADDRWVVGTCSDAAE